MQKFLVLGILGLISLTISCQQKENRTQLAATPSNTSSLEQEQTQEEAQGIKWESLTYAQRKGKLLYDKYCAVCHGLEGKGDGFNAYNLDPRPKDFTETGYLETVSDDWLREVIREGGRGVKRSVLMPSYENTLTKNQIEDVVMYLRFLSQK